MTKQLLKDLMSRNVEVVDPDTSIAEAARHMRAGDFGLLPGSDCALAHVRRRSASAPVSAPEVACSGL